MEKSIELVFEFEKATKNTMRFKEICGSNTRPVVGTLYVCKDALSSIAYADSNSNLKLTIIKEENK